MHPAKIQIRGFSEAEISKVLKKAEEFKAEVFKVENGTDLVFEDVENARRFISKLRREFRFETRMSTESLGFKGGRGRFLFVYSLRKY
ncbi:MAG: NMD3-related protein [Archaeoglobales archaeon]|nr:NMD3-related protein [Archaeoglobales archaeon]